MDERVKSVLYLTIPSLIVLVSWLLISYIFDIPFVSISNNDPIIRPVDQTTNVEDTPWAITWDPTPPWEQNTWTEIMLEPIDKVYSILENWKPWVDYTVLTFPPQNKVASTKEWLNNYLNQNIKSFQFPDNVGTWYLYLKLAKDLKSFSARNEAIGKYEMVAQPVNVKTNIYFNWWQVRGRLDLDQTLNVYKPNQEFLFMLSNVPVQYARGSNWLIMEWKILQIGWVVSNTNWNYIEKMIFIRNTDS